MTTRKITMALMLLFAASATFLSGCGAPATNNAAGNATNAAANSNAAANTGDSRAAAAVCTPSDDTLIETQMRILIDSTPTLFAQRQYINFDSKYCILKLQGQLNTLDDFKKLYDRASNIEGVRRVDVSGITRVGPMPTPTPVTGVSPTCSGDTKVCGQLCIPKDDECHIPVETKDKTPTPTP